MTDMRRTLLWVVFIMSLVLLCDAWNKQSGHPSMFGGPAPATTGTAAAPPRPGAGDVPAAVPAAVPGAIGATASAVAPVSPAASAPTGQQVTITTDVVKATFDSQGGTLVRLELLGYREAADPKEDVLLFDGSAAARVSGADRSRDDAAGRGAAQSPDADDD